MSIAVVLPALGESVVAGTVARWLVAEGDFVEVDQPLCEVTTDKVDAEIPSPARGVVEKILAPENAVVEVGAELATIDDRAGQVSAASAAPRATPVARRLAEQARLSLAAVEGTGSAGRVTKADVLSRLEPHAAGAAAGVPPAARPELALASPTPPLPQLGIELEEGDRVVPMTPQRRLTAAHMVYSKATSPHVGTVAEVDFGLVEELRRGHGPAFRERHGTPLTFLPFVAHSVVRGLRELPALNVSVQGDSIVERSGIHLSIAVETEKGLLVPVVRHADRLSLVGLALAVDELSRRARERKLAPQDLRGGTFTLSNPGRHGNLYGFAIINQPQVGILRMGELVKRPVVRSLEGEDAIVVRPTMHLALSYDHRAVDGAGANAFLHRVRELLEAGDFEL